VIERLIVGTGAASVAAAMAFRKRSVPFEVVDLGFDLESEREATIAKLRTTAPAHWSVSDRSYLYPPVVASAKGVEKRFPFGSDFPYREHALLTRSSTDCKVEVSHGYGGFGNVWGAAVLPYAASETADWPIVRADLEQSFHELGDYVPISGELSGLSECFPVYGAKLGTLQRTPQADFLMVQLEKRCAALARQGVAFERARAWL
jgi:hypothetical protein